MGEGICGGQNLGTLQGLNYAFTRTGEQEVVDCTFALLDSVKDPASAAVLKEVSPNLIGQYLQSVRDLQSPKYPRPAAIQWAGGSEQVRLEEVQRHAFGIVARHVPGDVLAAVAVHKAYNGASAISLGRNIANNNDAERKDQALQFISKVVDGLRLDGKLKSDLGDRISKIPPRSINELGEELWACLSNPVNCRSRGVLNYLIVPDRPVHSVAAAFTSLGYGDAPQWGRHIDAASNAIESAGLWPSVLNTSLNFAAVQTNHDDRAGGGYKDFYIQSDVLATAYHAGNADTREDVANAIAPLQAHLASVHSQTREGLGVRDGAPPEEFHLALMEHFLRQRDASPPVATEDQLKALEGDVKRLQQIASIEPLEVNDEGYQVAARSLIAVGQDAATLAKAVARFQSDHMLGIAAATLTLPDAHQAFEALARVVHDSHDPAACRKLAYALKEVSSMRDEENKELEASGHAAKSSLNIRGIATVLYSMASGHNGELNRY